MRLKRRETEIFSLSFLDCICCGFGAVILIFVLSIDSREKEKVDALASLRKILAGQLLDIAKLKNSKEDLYLKVAVRSAQTSEYYINGVQANAEQIAIIKKFKSNSKAKNQGLEKEITIRTIWLEGIEKSFLPDTVV